MFGLVGFVCKFGATFMARCRLYAIPLALLTVSACGIAMQLFQAGSQSTSESASLPHVTLACVSDTHGLHTSSKLSVPSGDVLVFAGDAGLDDQQDVARFESWLKGLPHQHKVVVWGNMDSAAACKKTDGSDTSCLRLENGLVLFDQIQEVAGYRILGSPWTPKFYGKWQLADEAAARLHWDRLLPPDTVVHIIITHGPPYGFGDKSRNRHVGDKALLEAVQRLKQPPLLWVCGHIHESYGQHRVPHPNKPEGILLINAAVNNLNRGEPGAAPRTVQLPEGLVSGPDTQRHRQLQEEQPASIWKAVVDFVGL